VGEKVTRKAQIKPDPIWQSEVLYMESEGISVLFVRSFKKGDKNESAAVICQAKNENKNSPWLKVIF
jgi:hypothetical protein